MQQHLCFGLFFRSSIVHCCCYEIIKVQRQRIGPEKFAIIGMHLVFCMTLFYTNPPIRQMLVEYVYRPLTIFTSKLIYAILFLIGNLIINLSNPEISSSISRGSIQAIQVLLVCVAQSVRGCLTNRENNETAAIQKKNERQIKK